MSNMDANEGLDSRGSAYRTQKMDALRELVGGIDHEINNLMQSIVASLELTRKLIATGRAGETEKFVANALASAQRAAALNHRLAVFALCRPPEPTLIAVGALVADVQDMLRASLGSAIRIEFEIESGLWKTLCDADQIENAIVNLVINARDAMPNGGAIVAAVSNTNVTKSGDVPDVPVGQYVSIAVTDVGAKRHQGPSDGACDSFVTSPPAVLDANSRLAWVRRFAREYGGDVTIDSHVGCGNTVTLHLPRYVVADVQLV